MRKKTDRQEKRVRGPSSFRVQRILSEHSRLVSDGPVKLTCPSCGASCLADPAQADGLCFACGTLLNPARAASDAACVRLARPFPTYDALLNAASAALCARDLKNAEELYELACTVNPKDGNAWNGLLMALTDNMHARLKEFPDDVHYQAALLMPPEKQSSFAHEWSSYQSDCRNYYEGVKEAEEKRQAAQQAARQRHKEAEQEAQRARRAARRSARNAPERVQARRRILSSVLGIGLTCLACVLLLYGTGFGFLFFLPLLMGGGRSNNNRRRR